MERISGFHEMLQEPVFVRSGAHIQDAFAGLKAPDNVVAKEATLITGTSDIGGDRLHGIRRLVAIDAKKVFSTLVGVIVGGFAGAIAGAAMGSVIPIVGTIIGGAIGAAIGVVIGAKSAQIIADVMFGLEESEQPIGAPLLASQPLSPEKISQKAHKEAPSRTLQGGCYLHKIICRDDMTPRNIFRMGMGFLFGALGGFAGGFAGSVIPGLGTVIGLGAGTVAGAWMGKQIANIILASIDKISAESAKRPQTS